MKTPVICAIALLSIHSLAFSQETSQEPSLPLDREITDTAGRKLNGTITAKSETGLKFRRTSDGKEFDIPLDKLSVIDRMFLGIDPPDALDTQRFPFRIHAPLRRHGKPNGGTTTIEPGEPVEMVAQDGKTITILHAGQELEFQIPTGGETTAAPPAKSRWNPVFPNMAPQTFLAAVTNDRDGPDPTIDKTWKQATEPAVEARESAMESWYRPRGILYAKDYSMRGVFMGLTPQTEPGEANTLNKEAQPTRANVFPAQLSEDPVSAVGCLYIDYLLNIKKKSIVPLDTYLKGIEETKAEIGWKTKFPISLPELAKAYIKILPDPGSRFSPASIYGLDSRRLAPILPFTQHNEVVIEQIKSSLRKLGHPLLISTIRWEGKAANGKDFGKTHITLGIGYKSDGTIKGTSLHCLDADGEIRVYPAIDVFAVCRIGITFKEDLISIRNPNSKTVVDPNDHVLSRLGDKRESLQVGITDTVFITTTSGAAAMIQFTKMEAQTRIENTANASASYRWKYRSASGQPVQNGTGELKVSYTISPIPDNPNGVKSTRNPDHNDTVKAGEISLSWSTSSDTQAYLYFYPSRGTAKIVPAEDFDKDF
jgi:hypothetical protein